MASSLPKINFVSDILRHRWEKYKENDTGNVAATFKEVSVQQHCLEPYTPCIDGANKSLYRR